MTDAGGSGGMPDLSGLLSQAQQMQERLLAAQQEAAEAEVEGHAGGGVVRIVATGGGEFRRVEIDPSVVDPADVSMLEDLILAALHDVTARMAELAEGAMGGGIGDLLGGLGGSLGGLFGGDVPGGGVPGLPGGEE